MQYTTTTGGRHMQQAQTSPGLPSPGFPIQAQRAHSQQASPGVSMVDGQPIPVETREQTITEFQRFPVTYPKKQQSMVRFTYYK
jgi:hypothetical protein